MRRSEMGKVLFVCAAPMPTINHGDGRTWDLLTPMEQAAFQVTAEGFFETATSLLDEARRAEMRHRSDERATVFRKLRAAANENDLMISNWSSDGDEDEQAPRDLAKWLSWKQGSL